MATSWCGRGRRRGRPGRLHRAVDQRAPSGAAPRTRRRVPTGFSGVPPPGPAMPVMPIPDVGAEPRDGARGQRRGHLRRDRPDTLDQLRRRPRRARPSPRSSTRPRRPARRPRSPARSVSRAAISPPVHDSATATVERGGPSSSPATMSSIVAPSRENTRSPCRSTQRRLERRVRRPPPTGSKTRRDLELAAPQAGRDLQRSSATPPPRARSVSASSDSGIPIMPHDPLLERPRARQQRPAAPAPSPPPPTSAAARPAARAARGRPGRPSTAARRGPGAVPTGSSTVAPRGTSACLRLPGPQRVVARGRASAPRSALGSGPDPLLQRLVERPSGTPANAATTSAVRSSAVGPSPPVVMIRSSRRGKEARGRRAGRRGGRRRRARARGGRRARAAAPTATGRSRRG